MNHLAEALARASCPALLSGPSTSITATRRRSHPTSEAGPRRPEARRPLHRRPRAVPDRHCRLRRHRPPRDDAARAYRRARLLRPPLRDAQHPERSPRSARPRSNNDVFRALAARLGLESDLFPNDETLIREALAGGPSTPRHHARAASRGVVRSASRPAPSAYTPVRRRRLPHSVRQVRALFRADEARRPRSACRTYIPPLGRPPKRDRSWPGSYPLQLLSPPRPQFLNSTFANSADPPRRPPATRPSRWPARMPRSVAWRTEPVGRGLQRPRVHSGPGSPSPVAVKPGVAVATGLYWNKLVPGLGNANSTTSTALTDMGGGATFFDNLVEVRGVRGGFRTMADRMRRSSLQVPGQPGSSSKLSLPLYESNCDRETRGRKTVYRSPIRPASLGGLAPCHARRSPAEPGWSGSYRPRRSASLERIPLAGSGKPKERFALVRPRRVPRARPSMRSSPQSVEGLSGAVQLQSPWRDRRTPG